MDAHHHGRAWVAGLVAALLLPGCFAVANLDRFDFDGGTCVGTAADTRDYSWNITGMDVAHPHARFEMKVVETGTERVAAAIVYDGVPELARAGVVGRLLHALAPGTYETRFWADTNHNAVFDFGADHGWREDVPESGCFAFAHNPPFTANIAPTDDPAKADVVLRFTGVVAFAGSPFIARVHVLLDTAEVEIGYYRLAALPATVDARHDLVLYDLAESDRQYFLSAFVDLDGDGRPSAGEPSVADVSVVATATGALFELDQTAL